MNFAPVSDVTTDPSNPIIGIRSFSGDKNIVAAMVTEEVKGMQKQNVSATLKHFPRHGDTTSDTHIGLATNETDLHESVNRILKTKIKRRIIDIKQLGSE